MGSDEIELIFEPMPDDMLEEMYRTVGHTRPSMDTASNESCFGYVDMAEPETGRVRARIVYYNAVVLSETDARDLWPQLWWQRSNQAPEGFTQASSETLIEQYTTSLDRTPKWWSWWSMDDQLLERITDRFQ